MELFPALPAGPAPFECEETFAEGAGLTLKCPISASKAGLGVTTVNGGRCSARVLLERFAIFIMLLIRVARLDQGPIEQVISTLVLPVLYSAVR